MLETVQIIARIRTAAVGGGDPRDPSLREAATQYAAACRDANARLEQCGALIRRGKRADAIRLAEAAPNLLQLAAALSIPEFDAWDRLCESHGFERPVKIAAQPAADLKQAYADEKQVRDLQSRRNTLGRPPGEIKPAPRMAANPPRTLTARKTTPPASAPPPLTPAETAAAQAKTPPPAPPAGIAGAVDPAAPPQAGARNVLLWVGAFIWPLLVIPAVVAWHLSTQQQPTRGNAPPDLTPRLADAQARAEALARQLTESESDAAGLRTELSKATTRLAEQEQDREQAKARLDQTAAVAAELKQENSRQADQILSLVNRMNLMAAAPSRADGLVQDPRPVTNADPTFALVDFTDTAMVLANPAPPYDRIEFVNPLGDKRLSASEKKTGDVPQLEISATLSDPAEPPPATRPANQLLGTVELDRDRGLIWTPSSVAGFPAGGRQQTEELLRGCGVAVYLKDRLAKRIQFGESELTMRLANGSVPVVSGDGRLPPSARLFARCDDSNWVMKPNADETQLVFDAADGSGAGFTISLDVQTGRLKSDWNPNRAAAAAALARAQAAVDADTAGQTDARQKANESRTLTDPVGRANSIQAANLQRIKAQRAFISDRRALEAATTSASKWNNFNTLKIVVRDPDTQMILKAVTVTR